MPARGRSRLIRLTVLITFVIGSIGIPTLARADWLITPFFGMKLGGNSNIAGARAADSKRIAIGGAVAILSDSVLGLEGEFAYYPRFFEGKTDELALVARSNVTTLLGNVVAAVPISITRDSLRPYASGGVGVMHIGLDFVGDLLLPVDANMLAMNVGGGVIGPLRHDLSVRFDARFFRSVTTPDVDVIDRDRPQLSFWRLSAGLTLRY